MIHKYYYEDASEAEWLKLRKGLIAEERLGGSMVGVAAGMSSYKSRLRLYGELRGEIPEQDLSQREAVRVGKDLEGYVAKRFTELSGKKVHRENCIFVNDAHPNLFATIDRKITCESSGLECKTANAMMAAKFTDDKFPESYYAQVCSYLAVTEMERWYLCVCVMGIATKVYLLTTIPEEVENKPAWVTGATYVSPEELQACNQIAAAFWQSVRLGDMPIDGDDDTTDVLKAYYPKSNGVALEFGGEIDTLLQERDFLKQEVKQNEARITEIDNVIRMRLGGAEVAYTPSYKVTWKSSDTTKVTNAAIAKVHGGTIPPEYYETTSSRTLRISKNKTKKGN